MPVVTEVEKLGFKPGVMYLQTLNVSGSKLCPSEMP